MTSNPLRDSDSTNMKQRSALTGRLSPVVSNSNVYSFRSEELRQCRLAAGLSLGEVAKVAGVTKRTLEKLEAGKQRPDREVLDRLMGILQINVHVRPFDRISTEVVETKLSANRKVSR